MKKIYIQPNSKVYTVKVCTPIAFSQQSTGDDTPEAGKDEEFNARGITGTNTDLWSTPADDSQEDNNSGW